MGKYITTLQKKNFLKNIYQPNFSAKKQKYPAVLILHEITGITEHTKKVAKKFASEGFIVATPNLFENKNIQKIFQDMPRIFKQAQDNGEDLTKLNKKINEKLYKILNSKKFINATINKLSQWIDFLGSLDVVDDTKISVIGFSFGGWYAFKLAQLHNKIDKVIIFYGFYDIANKLIKQTKCPILGFYGELESNIDKIDKIKEVSKKYNKPIKIYMCKQAKHSFFDDTNLKRYNKKASDFAWEKTLKFLGD